MVDVDSQYTEDSQNWGVLLPPEILPHSISILPSPSYDDRSDRALLLISSIGSQADYAVILLQFVDEVRGDEFKDTNNLSNGHVLARLYTEGTIPCNESSITGVFLAGGSFAFELENGA